MDSNIQPERRDKKNLNIDIFTKHRHLNQTCYYSFLHFGNRLKLKHPKPNHRRASAEPRLLATTQETSSHAAPETKETERERETKMKTKKYNSVAFYISCICVCLSIFAISTSIIFLTSALHATKCACKPVLLQENQGAGDMTRR